MAVSNAIKSGNKKSSLVAKKKVSWDLRAELDPRLLWLLWWAAMCFLGTSIFATHMLSVMVLPGSDQFETETSPKELTVTIYAAPAPFKGSVAIRQELAINSWLRLDPCPNVVLLGQHSSIRAFAAEKPSHVTVDANIDFTFAGKPLFHGMVQKALNTSTDIVMMIDPDVVLLDHCFLAIKSLKGFNQDWLLAALPRSVPSFPFSLQGKKFESFGVQVEDEEVEAYVKDNGLWDTCEGGKLWAWNGNQKPLHAGVMPPFVYGEGQHNNWLLAETLTSKYRVVLDASEAITAFRIQDISHDTVSMSSVLKLTSDRLQNISGNSWLASTYGSYYFRPVNFSNIAIKLLKCGDLQSGKLCMAETSHNPCSCSPLDTLAVPEERSRAQRDETFPLLYQTPTWTSSFEDFLDWIQRDLVPGSWYRTGSKTHGHVNSQIQAMMMLSSENNEVNCGCSMVPYEQKVQCKDIHQVGTDELKLSYNSLELLVNRVANEDKVVILAVVGNSYRDMLMSWVCRLKQLHISNFMVSALDDDIYHFAILQGLPVFRGGLDMEVSRNDCHFGTQCFQKVTKMKSRTVLQILQLGFHVLMSDVDVYWFQDPLKELMLFGPGHLTAQTDNWNETEALNQPRRLNSGFYFAWSDYQTIAAFQKIIEHAESSDKSEQPSFYDVLCGPRGEYRVGNDICIDPHLNLTVKFLDPVKFPNGAFRLLWEEKNVRAACRQQGCIILHNNWVPGRQKKLDRQIASGLWEYDSSMRMCLRNRE